MSTNPTRLSLANLIGDTTCRLDLIDVSDLSAAGSPAPDEYRIFRDALSRLLKQPVVRRYSGGADITPPAAHSRASREITEDRLSMVRPACTFRQDNSGVVRMSSPQQLVAHAPSSSSVGLI